MIGIGDSFTADNERCLQRLIGDIDVTVTSDADDVLDDFAALYAVDETCRETVGPPIRMEVRMSRRAAFGRKRYTIFGDGKELFSNRRSLDVLPYLEWGINWRVMETRAAYLQLHAATLSFEGQGVVLVGNSGVGKSTLAAGLVSRGWTYLSDEFALIDPDTLRLHPFPKAMCIKAGSFDVIERLNLPLWRRRHYVKALKGPVGYIRPQDFAPGVKPKSCPIRFVIFPKYGDGEEPRFYPILSGHSAFAMAGHAFNRHVFGKRAISILSEVARRAECLGLVSGPIDETCNLIETLVSDAHPDGWVRRITVEWLLRSDCKAAEARRRAYDSASGFQL
jgi:hypothetical protein